jgi:cytosine/uracil/thiamine/allantoin permease
LAHRHDPQAEGLASPRLAWFVGFFLSGALYWVFSLGQQAPAPAATVDQAPAG